MNEWLLIITVVALIIVAQLLLRLLKQPVVTYVRISFGVLLLGLVWAFGEQDQWPVKLILTAVVVGSLITTVKDFRKPHVGLAPDPNE